MASLQEIKKRLLDLQGKEMELVQQAIAANEEVFVNAVAGQLAQGIKSDGTKSAYVYRDSTIRHKQTLSGLAAVTDHLTNYDTGESYRGLYAKVDGSGNIKFGTTSSKEDAISERMKGKAFAPDPENKETIVRQHLQPEFNRLIREMIKL